MASFDSVKLTRVPVDMILFCPLCERQHIDVPGRNWDNPPHKSHQCQGCGHVWRVADVPTNGVGALRTEGKDDRSADPALARHAHHALMARQRQKPEDFDDYAEACKQFLVFFFLLLAVGLFIFLA